MTTRLPSADELVADLVGRTIPTVADRPNTVIRVSGDNVVVGTSRSPDGAPVPLAWVQDALDRLAADGVVEISVDSLGHRRSAFVGAVLLALPGTELVDSSPPRVALRPSARGEYRETMAGTVNAWWDGTPSERYWLETTDRPDIGVDLHAPQRDAASNATPGYSLMWWVRAGDVVLHYDRNTHAIAAYSRAVGTITEAPVIWLSHRGATRRRVGRASPQPGWWLDLEGPYRLNQPLTLAQLREKSAVIRSILEKLRATHSGSLYFPFSFYRNQDLRPMQPYLNKMPAALVTGLVELAEVANAATGEASVAGSPGDASSLGASYRVAAVSDPRDDREPFAIDPAIVERGLRGHAETQNALAAALEARGIEPRSPRPDEPNFDLAWQVDDEVYVAEVKSITPQNQERQLRLGLGQVLRYRNLLAAKGHSVQAVLVAERLPQDASWHSLCFGLGVALVTPPSFVDLPPGSVNA